MHRTKTCGGSQMARGFVRQITVLAREGGWPSWQSCRDGLPVASSSLSFWNQVAFDQHVAACRLLFWLLSARCIGSALPSDRNDRRNLQKYPHNALLTVHAIDLTNVLTLADSGGMVVASIDE